MNYGKTPTDESAVGIAAEPADEDVPAEELGSGSGLFARTGGSGSRNPPSREQAEAAVRVLIEWAADNLDREGLQSAASEETRAHLRGIYGTAPSAPTPPSRTPADSHAPGQSDVPAHLGDKEIAEMTKMALVYFGESLLDSPERHLSYVRSKIADVV